MKIVLEVDNRSCQEAVSDVVVVINAYPCSNRMVAALVLALIVESHLPPNKRSNGQGLEKEKCGKLVERIIKSTEHALREYITGEVYYPEA